MIRLFTVAAFLLVAGVTQTVRAEAIDVFLLAGQSNMSGRVNTGYSADARDAQVRYYYRTDGPAATDVNSGAFTTLAPLATGYYGPEITMGRALVTQGYNPAIIKVSDGGTSLATHWKSRPTVGAWWNNWKSTVATALDQLEADGHTVTVRGFFWLQGETDAGNLTSANNYQTNFTHLTADVATYLTALGHDTTHLSYVTALIHNPSGSAAYVDTVRAAQQNVMNALPHGAYFDTNDLTMQSDNLHFTAASIQTIGTRFADTYATTVPEPSALLLGGAAMYLTLSRAVARRRKARTGPLRTIFRGCIAGPSGSRTRQAGDEAEGGET